jgi:hypothetical protein
MNTINTIDLPEKIPTITVPTYRMVTGSPPERYTEMTTPPWGMCVLEADITGQVPAVVEPPPHASVLREVFRERDHFDQLIERPPFTPRTATWEDVKVGAVLLHQFQTPSGETGEIYRKIIKIWYDLDGYDCKEYLDDATPVIKHYRRERFLNDHWTLIQPAPEAK